MSSIPDRCLACGLYEGCKSPMMPGHGSEHPKLILVGEGPGANEDEQGIPFVGKAGHILRSALDVLGLDPSEYRMTNTVRCRPPDNRTPRAKEIELCSEFLAEELRRYNPPVVVLLGNTPLKAVLGESGITTWNGVVVQRNGRVYVPAFHPSFFNYGNQEYMEDWLNALSRAIDLADGGAKVQQEDTQYVFPRRPSEVSDMMEEVMAFDGYVSYDVEAMFLEPERAGNRILSFSFGIMGKAWAVPLDHDDAPWYGTSYDRVVRSLENILTNKCIIGHNVRFDCRQTRTLLGVEFRPWGDTMLISQLVDTRKGIHGLKRLAGLYLGMFDYDKELQDYIAQHPEADYARGGHYGNVPLDVLLPYGGMDAAATWRLYSILEGQLTDAQRVLYRELLMAVDYELGWIEANGFMLDKYIAERYRRIYSLVQARYYDQMANDPYVRKWVRKRKEDDKRFVFNPNSSQQMAELFYDVKGHGVTARTAGGIPSVKVDVIKNNTVKNDALYEPYRRWKLISSMLNKYLEPASSGEWDAGDDRVRSSYNLGGTKTGRLSSSSPNLQNIPTPEKEPGTLLAQLPIKNIFTHTWRDGCLCAVDYGSMELRVMASVANCPGMIQVFKEGKDPHCYVTRMVFPHLVPPEADDKVIKHDYKEVRYKAKGTNWTLLYGGDEHTLWRMYGLPLEEATAIVKSYYEKFPEILDYQERTVAFARRTGYVETPFGRRLYLPYINDADGAKAADERRTAVNMPIQSLASDVLLCSMVVIGDKMDQLGLRTMLVNTVHDSLVADIYPGELDTFVRLAVDVMENIASYALEYFPHMDFSWLRVPLKADVEVGSHYGSLEEYQWE